MQRKTFHASISTYEADLARTRERHLTTAREAQTPKDMGQLEQNPDYSARPLPPTCPHLTLTFSFFCLCMLTVF